MLPQTAAPLDGFAVRFQRTAGRTLTPGPRARLAARVRPGSLDRALIAGEDPAGSAQLAARAGQLTSPRTRVLVADGLERLIEAARGPQRRWWAVGERAHLLANATEMGELAMLLRGGAPLYAPGIAILGQLLTDGTGPAYRGGAERLAQRLEEARRAL